MATHEVLLASSDKIAEGTTAFQFTKPAGFAFKPGQAIDLILPGAEGLRHTFSIASAPFEEHLLFATRMRDSAYKHELQLLQAGAPAIVEGPFGSFSLHKDAARPAVLIAGGIGITPFLSMLRQTAYEQRPQQLLLLYSNRRPEEAAFLDELQQLPRRHEHLCLVATMTHAEKSAQPWKGPTSRIDADFIRHAARELQKPIYYVAGPPVMVEAMRGLLNRMDIDEDAIRSEEFYGYQDD